MYLSLYYILVSAKQNQVTIIIMMKTVKTSEF